MSQNTFAESLGTANFDMNWRSNLNNNYGWTNGLLYGSPNSNYVNARQVRKYQFNTPAVSAAGTNAVIHFETNVVYSYFTGFNQVFPTPVSTDNLPYMGILACSSPAGNLKITGSSLSNTTTQWFSGDGASRRNNLTITFYGDVALKGFNKGSSGLIVCSVGSNDYTFFDTLTGQWTPVVQNSFNGYLSYFEKNPMSITWTDNSTELLLQQQINQTQQMIQQNQTIIEQNNREYEQQQQAIDNISNQSPSDIDNAENAATTNLIGVLSGFINAFSNINATNCSLTLEFPDYAGGSRVVDICQGKEKAPRIVEIGSSLLLIAVFVPLAYILIKMIYNEIRSWTNG